MTDVFTGTELEAFTKVGSGISETTSGATFNSSYARCAIYLGSSGGMVETPYALGSLTQIGIHGEFIGDAGGGSGSSLVIAYDNTGTAVFRVAANATRIFQPQYWSGSAWVNIGGTWAITDQIRYAMDLRIVCGASLSFEFCIDGSLASSGSAAVTSVANVDKVRFGQVQTNVGMSWSQIKIKNKSTLGCRVETETATGNGTDVDGTGDYTTIDETSLNDVDFTNLPSSGNRRSFTSPARTQAAAPAVVSGVTVTARALSDSGQSLKFYLKISGTRYYSPNIALTTSFASYQYTWQVDPSTAAAWTISAAQASTLEWGYEVV